MADKVFNTRIQLKYDTLANWTSANPVLLKGEVAMVEVPAASGAVKQEPAILTKVGDGAKHFKDLPFTAAVAADVANWAKADNRPAYAYGDADLTGFAKIANTGTAADVAVADALSHFTATNVEAALEELYQAVNSGGSGSILSITKDTSSSDYAARYIFKQGSNTLSPTIDIPKDMVVSSGEVKVNPSGQPAGTYLVLTLANATSDKVYINVGSLIEYVTAGDDTATGHVEISADHKVTMSVKDGSIGATQLDAATKASLAKADAAVAEDDLAAVAFSGDANDLTQTSGEYFILSCGSSTLNV